MTDYQLFETRTATFNASGIALIPAVGPTQHGETWTIKSTSVESSSTDPTTLQIYRSGSLARAVEGTVRGNLDTSNTEFFLNSGQQLWFQWTGGTPGTQAKLSLEGLQHRRGNQGGGIR